MSFGANSSSSSPVDLTPDAFRNLQPFLADQLRNLSGGGPTFGGNFAAPLGAGEQTALNRVQDLAFGSPTARATDDLLASTLRGDFLSPESNPALQQTIDAAIRPIQQQFQDNELQNRALFTRAGQKIQESSPFSQAQAKLGEGFLNAVGDTTGRIVNENFQQERNRQIAAVSQAGARFDQATRALEASALPRLVEQLGIDGGVSEFNRRMDMIRDVLQIGAGVTRPVVANETESSGFNVGLPFSASVGG